MKSDFHNFLESFNHAFAAHDISSIANGLAEDVVWRMVGEKEVKGKEEVIRFLENMKSDTTYRLTIDTVITHGTTAAVNGVIEGTSPSGNVTAYEFCDIYKMNKHKGGKIKELTSFVIEKKDV
ncbi:nuclear transport factor 2 family protein [Salipaludibacillus agaradhaerens]|uniref:nuclear transport factor 2 family protein n=1 Tax=Salipaludibacillus agaradhaerens TaxID=76935 RepID=UPI000998C200|nr:nuclear transport factor 2 family protein [Salipaludibacillus agaradhaerens]